MTMTAPDARRIHVPVGAALPADITMTATQMHVPTERYTSLDFHRREIEQIWLNSWQNACRVDEVAQPGDYLEYKVGDQSILVVHGQDGVLRAFFNACRHRGNLIKKGCGNAGELKCQYHFWSWNLDGSLRNVPDRQLFCGFDDGDVHLTELPCDTWGGFVFVHPNPQSTQPLLDFLGALPDQLAPYHLDEMVPVGVNITRHVAANWKVVVEAFLEVYHVQGIHPQLMPMLDDLGTWFQTTGDHSLMIVPFGVASQRLGDIDELEVLEGYLANLSSSTGNRGAGGDEPGEAVDNSPKSQLINSLFELVKDESGEYRLPDGFATTRDFFIDLFRRGGESAGQDYSGLSDDQMVDDWHYHIFPNLVFNTHAGNFLFFRILPDWDDPNQCTFHMATYRWLPEDQRATGRTAHTWVDEDHSLGVVIDQDMENLPGVQRGLHSRGLEHLTISKQEIRLVQMHEVIDRYLAR